MKKRYVEMPMTFDPMFKSFMGADDNRRYLARVIMVVTGIDENLILEQGEIINSELLIKKQKEKAKRSDLIIVIDKNVVNIEMNNDIYYKDKNYNYMYKIAIE